MKFPRLSILLLLLATPAWAAVFQYSLPVETQRREKIGSSTAFLWIPPAAQQVRGILVAGMTSAEREVVKDAQIRAACADQGLAIIFIKSGLGQIDLPKLVEAFAQTSGYQELPVAPLMFFGHSAGGPQAKALATKFADRCFGLILHRGDVPGGEQSLPGGIPALTLLGQFDEFGGVMRDESGREAWQNPRDGVATYRAADPANLASIAVEPGAGHFTWSDRNSALTALFIRKAAQARIPDWPVDAKEPVQCKPIEPASGWLTSFDVAQPGEPAAYADFAGEKAQAAWHFDREMAEAVAAYHAGLSGKKDQFITWQDPVNVDAGARFFFSKPEWIGDGQTFQPHPVYREKYPEPQPTGGPKWAQAGQPVTHTGAPITLKLVGGPAVISGTDKVRIAFDNLAPATEGGRVTFAAFSPASETHRYTEQVGMLQKDFKGFSKGADNTITFPPINGPLGSEPIPLKASSSAGLPVEFYVAYGPAEVADGKLVVSQIPVRAKKPIEVKIVAYQFGSAIEPQVKTAAAVEQTLQVGAP